MSSSRTALRRSCAALVAALAVSNTLLAAPPRVIVSSHPTNDTSLVPDGIDPSERFGSDFGEIYRSANGLRWIVAVRTNFNRVGVLTGEGLVWEAPFLANATTQLPWTTPEEPDFYLPAVPGGGGFDSFDVDNGIYAVNDAGDLAITVREANLSKKEMAKRAGGVWSRVVRDGDDVPFDAGDDVYGGTLLPFGLSADGADVYFIARDTVGSLPTTSDDFVVIGPTTLQSGVSAVAGRTMESIATGTARDVRASADGSQYVLYANLSGATTDDDVIVRNASITVQEGTPLGAFSVVGNRLAGVSISGNGQWYVHRGQAAGTVDWVARNGAVVASKGAPTHTGSSDTWASFTGFSRTFLSVDVDNAGHYTIYGGALSGGLNVGMIVYNGERELVRDGDGVDLNGDGLANDDAFIDFNGGTGGETLPLVLGGDGYVYFVARLRDSNLVALGEALLRVPVADAPAACNLADITDVGDSGAGPDGQLTLDDILGFINDYNDSPGCPGASPCNRADVTDVGDSGAGPDGQLTLDDILAFINAYNDGC